MGTCLYCSSSLNNVGPVPENVGPVPENVGSVPEYHGTAVWSAKNQEDRAEKMKHYVLSALGNPQIVGVHWHQFSDQPVTGRFDGEGLQVGLTDVCDRPYPIMRAALREVSGGMYSARFETHLKRGDDFRKSK